MMQTKKQNGEAFAYLSILVVVLCMTMVGVYANPSGASVAHVTNATKAATTGIMVNNSQVGGYIYTMNISGFSQNPRWKAYIGNVSGKYVLEDASGYRIYDWTISSVTGEVYATRYSGSVSWGTIGCANSSQVETENIAVNHTSADDNITTTFGTGTHSQFYVGDTVFTTNVCSYSGYTFVNNVTQSTSFDEILLHDNTSLVYTTIIESSIAGFDNTKHDFQILLPELGYEGWAGSTAYYFYVELSAV